MQKSIYLALGTNLGDRALNLQAARDALPPTVKLVAASPVYETPPWGVSDQPAFLNQVVHVETELSPLELLHYLKELENRLGREPSIRYGPRQIDLDILFYGHEVISYENLTIPHARLHERAFVLVPLADLAPEFRHPRLGASVIEMLAKMDTTGVEKISS
ncbi:MAG: 2-amino-4-hydroxy-6-hydroxymethyldihydropteridine diphosphokinase [Chloroflexi bacterium]|jgi:2-amino-4-hydroxy-6-hydroxymethyldihydropteridine diphosphokinase|nr:2-amino-4-hydroxy-6-hydroxymethyldihydropteridine diphosphokinase [Chloroflexota bacterium]